MIVKPKDINRTHQVSDLHLDSGLVRSLLSPVLRVQACVLYVHSRDGSQLHM